MQVLNRTRGVESGCWKEAKNNKAMMKKLSQYIKCELSHARQAYFFL